MGKCNFRAFLCFGLILAAVLLYSVSPAREVAVIKVEQRNSISSKLCILQALCAGRRHSNLATVESGFEVTPTLAGNNAHLKIVPRIAYDDRQDAVIRFFGAQTELTVPLGRWVEIGADRAAYATMLFPVVALGISTVYEGYQWYSFFIRSLSKNANKTNETET